MPRPLPTPSRYPRSLGPLCGEGRRLWCLDMRTGGAFFPPLSGLSVVRLLGLPLAFPRTPPQWDCHNVRSVGVDETLKGPCIGPLLGSVSGRPKDNFSEEEKTEECHPRRMIEEAVNDLGKRQSTFGTTSTGNVDGDPKLEGCLRRTMGIGIATSRMEYVAL